MRIYKPVQWIWTFKRWLSYHADDIRDLIGKICKWIVYSTFVALVSTLLVFLFIWNFWGILVVGLVVAILFGWIFWGLGI